MSWNMTRAGCDVFDEAYAAAFLADGTGGLWEIGQADVLMGWHLGRLKSQAVSTGEGTV